MAFSFLFVVSVGSCVVASVPLCYWVYLCVPGQSCVCVCRLSVSFCFPVLQSLGSMLYVQCVVCSLHVVSGCVVLCGVVCVRARAPVFPPIPS